MEIPFAKISAILSIQVSRVKDLYTGITGTMSIHLDHEAARNEEMLPWGQTALAIS